MTAIILGVLRLGRSSVVVEIIGRIDAKTFEDLRLDIAAVARRHGLRLKSMALKGGRSRRAKRGKKKKG